MRLIRMIIAIVGGGAAVIYGIVTDLLSIWIIPGGLTIPWKWIIIIAGAVLAIACFLIEKFYNNRQNQKKRGRIERYRLSEGKCLVRTVAIPDVRYGYYVSFCCRIDKIDEAIGYGSVHNIISSNESKTTYMDIEVHAMSEEHKEVWKRIFGNDKLVLEKSYIIPSVSRDAVKRGVEYEKKESEVKKRSTNE